MNMINVFILSSLSPPVECFVCPWSSNVVISMYCVCVVWDSTVCGVWEVFVCLCVVCCHGNNSPSNWVISSTSIWCVLWGIVRQCRQCGCGCVVVMATTPNPIELCDLPLSCIVVCCCHGNNSQSNESCDPPLSCVSSEVLWHSAASVGDYLSTTATCIQWTLVFHGANSCYRCVCV